MMLNHYKQQLSFSQIPKRLLKAISFLGLLCLAWLSWQTANLWFLPSLTPTEFHVLSRLSYGSRPSDVRHIKQVGFEQYIQEQLHPEKTSESPVLAMNLGIRHLIENAKYYRAVWQQSPMYPPDQREGFRQTLANEFDYRQAIQNRVLRAIFSQHQLQELLVEFWYNHFNVSGIITPIRGMVGEYEASIRPLVLGDFETLLKTTMRSPAMLSYLDNYLNNYNPDPNSDRKSYNENYARELLELHTLGENDAYTQADVEALARILTGWGLSASPYQHNPREKNSVIFTFHEDQHDPNDKEFMGEMIRGGGESEVERVAEILAHHPATAHHISQKLAKFFLAEQPPDSLVDKLSQVFQETDGDISSVLLTLFQSPEFFQSDFIHNQFKTPYQYLISLLRMTNTSFVNIIDDDDRNLGILDGLERLGMLPFSAPSPKGYDSFKQIWLTDQGLLQRLYLARTIPSGMLTHWSWYSHRALRSIVEPHIAEHTKQVLTNSASDDKDQLLLSVPFLMYR